MRAERGARPTASGPFGGLAATERAGWAAALTAAEAEQAQLIVVALASELVRLPVDGVWLTNGLPARAVVVSVLARERLLAPCHASAALAAARRALASDRHELGLMQGVAGVVWASAQLRGAPEVSRSDARALRAIIAHVSRRPWRGEFDLISGLVGFGVLGLELAHEPVGRELTAAVVHQLDELAVRDRGGIAWADPPALVAGPHPSFDTGMAHGSAGVVSFLASAVNGGLAPADLLAGGADWLTSLGGRLRGRPPPAYIVQGRPVPGSRVAWCHGAPAIALAALRAAIALDDEHRIRAAIELARDAVRLTESRAAGVVEAGLCQGAAGLGLIFQRIAALGAGIEALDASRRWYRRLLERAPAVGVGDSGLLDGAGGIALALWAACAARPPEWDRSLLLSCPGPAP